MDDSIEIENVKKLILKNLQSNKAYVDGYIDNILTLILDEPNSINKRTHAIPLICYIILFRVVHIIKPLSRSEILCKVKRIAEGTLLEQKIILGWTIGSRRMILLLRLSSIT